VSTLSAGPGGEPGLAAGLSRQNSVYRRMTAVCDRVADAALRGASAAELASVFSEMTRKTVLLLDPEFGLRTRASAGQGAAGPPWDPAAGTVARLLRVLAAERRPLRVPPVPGSALPQGCLAMPVTAGDSALGYLLVLDETGEADPDDADLIITSYVATLFALTLAREQTTLELGLRYQGTVVDSLVSGHFLDHHDAQRKAQELGLADGQPFRVAIARPQLASAPGPDPVGNGTGLAGGGSGPVDTATELAGGGFGLVGSGAGPAGGATAQRLMGDLAVAARSPFVLRGSELVMIVPETPGGAATGRDPRQRAAPLDVLARLLASRAAGAAITCGVSERVAAPDLAPRSLRQAEQALELGVRLGRTGQLVRYEDLGIYRLLLQIGDMNQLWRFAADVLGPLLDYDATHKVGLVATLSAYLGQHESLKQAARVLRVHVNTVAYRVQRIEQLTALDLAAPDDRLLAHIAVKIIEAQTTPGTP
jgi:hypothetical protein